MFFEETYEVPTYFTTEVYYRPFTSGAGYILPWSALTCLYQQSLILPYYFIEDVFLTGWIGESIKKQYKQKQGSNLPTSKFTTTTPAL
jgi:hypothetical protein